MSINKLIMDTLKPLGVPISFAKYVDKYLDWDSINKWTENNTYWDKAYKNMYITFNVISENGQEYAEGNEIATKFIVQIDVWSKTDYTELVENVIKNMQNAGFIRQNAWDLYESDTQIYHKAIRFFYLKQNER